MAEIILEDVDRLIDNVLSLMWDCKEELKHLLHQLHKIKFVLPDAQKRQESDGSVRSWLMKLRDVANDVNDELDKFSYEISQKKLKVENQTMDQVRSFSFHNSFDKIVNDIDVLGLTMKLGNPISKCSEEASDESVRSWLMEHRGDESVRSWLMEHRDEANYVSDAISHRKIEVENQKMDLVGSFCNLDGFISTQQLLDKNGVAALHLGMELGNPSSKICLEKNMDTFQDNSEVVGRDFDVVKIVTLLTNSSNEQGISVLPIVGMAGLGKTTLANHLFNLELVKKHFDVLAWVHIGRTFNATGILREIVTYLKGHLNGLKDDEVFQKLKELLSGKKYFFVLDDVWNEEFDKWEVLSGYLSGISFLNGNKIIVTTRSDNAAKIMGTVSAHCLEKLSKDDCWYILKRSICKWKNFAKS